MLKLICSLSFFILFSCAGQKAANEKKAELYFSYGTSALVQKQYTEALDNLLKAYELSPHDSRINNNLGMAYFFKKDLTKAVFYIQKSLDYDPKNTDAKFNLASFYFQDGKYDNAEKAFQEVLKDLTYTQQFRTYYNLGLLELKKKNIDSALDFFQLSVKEEEAYCPSHYQMGEILSKKSRLEDALKSYRLAQVGTCFSNPIYHMREAQAMVKLKQWKKAKTKLNDIITRFANSPTEKEAKSKLFEVERNVETEEDQLIHSSNQGSDQEEIASPHL